MCIAKGTIAALIKKNGGRHGTKVNGEEEGRRTTHLVTTTKQIEAQAEKGKDISCPLNDYAWRR